MVFELLQLPEEIIIVIVEFAALEEAAPTITVPSAGFRSLCEDTSLSPLSFTCQTVRRLTLPILFRSLSITPGIAPRYRFTPYKEQEMALNALRGIELWKKQCVK